jgi:pheromone shutdown protein TraB
MSIKIVGSSHISQESIERINEAYDSFEPDIVCLELDMGRLNALLTDSQAQPENIVHMLLGKFQRYLGGKTGVMPGEEMLHAYREAQSRGLEVFLVDRDIRETLGRLKYVRRKEKVKALAMVPFSLFSSKINIAEIPDEKMIEEVKERFSESFPELYRVLLEERDFYMSEAVRKVRMANPGKDILVVVGAAHKQGLEERIDEINRQSPVEETRQSTLES